MEPSLPFPSGTGLVSRELDGLLSLELSESVADPDDKELARFGPSLLDL